MKPVRERGLVYPQNHSRTKSLEVLPPPRARDQVRERITEAVLSPDSEVQLTKVQSWSTNPNMSDLVKSRSTSSRGYRRSPLRLNIKASKTSAFYNAHSYPTKVPPEIIEPFISHYTEEGDLILDPFCGSGMTGVAALRKKRRVILRDLSPAATHIAYNNCTPVDLKRLKNQLDLINEKTRDEFNWLYGTICETCNQAASIDYVVWSDVFRCPSCDRRIVYWNTSYDPETKTFKDKVKCECGESYSKGKLAIVDEVPIETHFHSPKCKNRRHKVTEAELDRILEINSKQIPYWYPTNTLDKDSDMYYLCGLEKRKIERVPDFYTKRNLWALSRLWDEIEHTIDPHIKRRLQFVFTSAVNRASKRYVWSPKRPLNVHVSNLYVPSIRCEFNVGKLFNRKFNAILESSEEASEFEPSDVRISTASATDLKEVPAESVDYVFTDPPFGKNIFYADLHLMWEAWLGHYTNQEKEMVISRARKQKPKTLQEYQKSMSEALNEISRVLKPEHWATMVFQNSDVKTWAAVQRAAVGAGFHIRGASILDKGQYSPKQLKGITGTEKVPTLDIAFNMHKTESKSKSQLARPLDVKHEIRRVLKKTDVSVENGSSLANLYVLVIQEMLNSNLDVSEVNMSLVSKIQSELRGN